MAAAGGALWSSRFGFIMAAAGFAIGLGNVWRFPYMTGENGGAAFVLVYLACAFGIGAPILIAEILIGRRGQGSAPTALACVAAESGQSKRWGWLGAMGLLAAYTIEIVYAVVCGWVLWYLFKAVTTGFVGFDSVTANAEFAAVLDDNLGMMFWTLVGLAITGLIIYAGVKDGIERAVIILMPLLFLLLAGLAVYNYFTPAVGPHGHGFTRAITWLFTPDFSKIGFDTVLAAIGQAFFSLSVAMAGMMVYGAYLPKSVSITRSVLIIVTMDTAAALLAGLVVFPVVFQNGMDPAAGVGLIFKTLPVGFAQMPGGHGFSVLFFLMLAVAGITSMVGLIEAVNAWLDDRFGMPRHKSVLLVVGSIAVFSVLSSLSYNVIDQWTFNGKNFNDSLDYFSNQILLPVGGLLIAIFAGWVMNREATRDELGTTAPVYTLWRFLIRFVVPPAVLVVFVMGVFG
jgi:NSS family neurotransmitter:Na+ symporter